MKAKKDACFQLQLLCIMSMFYLLTITELVLFIAASKQSTCDSSQGIIDCITKIYISNSVLHNVYSLSWCKQGFIHRIRNEQYLWIYRSIIPWCKQRVRIEF